MYVETFYVHGQLGLYTVRVQAAVMTLPVCQAILSVDLSLKLDSLAKRARHSDVHGLESSEGVPAICEDKLLCGLCKSCSVRYDSGVHGPFGGPCSEMRCGSLPGGGGPGGMCS